MIIPLVKIFRTERYKNKLLALVTALRTVYGLSVNGTIRKRKITETPFVSVFCAAITAYKLAVTFHPSFAKPMAVA